MIDQCAILVFGCSALGQAVAEQLTSRGYPTYLFSNDMDEVSDLLAKGFDAAHLDYMDDERLRAVGIGKRVKTIFCLFSEESKNVFLTLSARALEPELKIVCVSESSVSSRKLIAAGASKVIDPYEISGRKVHELITRPMIVDMLEQTVFGKYIDIAQIEIPENSCLTGESLFTQELKNHKVILLGVVDIELSEELIFSTSGIKHKLDAGDMLVVIGPEKEIARLKEDIQHDRKEELLGR
ncbi:MAG: NAD-binding protein [Pseudomonadota bacterium]